MSAFSTEEHSHLPAMVLRGLRPSVWLWVPGRAVTRTGLRLLVPGPALSDKWTGTLASESHSASAPHRPVPRFHFCPF